jgi:hypothetical protein
MDAFLAICQGLGLALAAGLVIGVVLPPIMPTWGVLAGAAPLGVLAAAAPLSGADEPVWPALPVGAIAAGMAAVVARDVASGAARRQGTAEAESARGFETQLEQPSSAITAIIVLAAAAVALLSLVLPPISLVALGSLAWLWLTRRRREARKHEGLRVLR